MKSKSLIIIALLLLCQFDLCHAAKKALTPQQIFDVNNKAVGIVVTYDKWDQPVALGSAFVVSSDGKLITNIHVMKGAYRAGVNLSGKIYEVLGVVDFNEAYDLACIEINAQNLTAVKLGDSSKAKVGEKIYAIGNPQGLENTISDGIISSIRKLDGIKIIQVTSPISHGSSGGPLINKYGEVIGINTAAFNEGQNLNFAVPIGYAKPLIKNKTQYTLAAFNDLVSGNGSDNTKNIEPSGQSKNHTKTMELDPKDASAYNERGCSKDELGDHTGAIEDYTKAIELNPNYSEAYYNRGIAKTLLKDHTGAIEDYAKAIELNPKDAEPYNNRGWSKAELGDYSGAIQDYNKAMEINPNIAETYYNRGFSKGKLKDHTGAIQDFTKAIELDPKFAGAYRLRGLSKDMLKDFTGAIQDYNTAIEIDPTLASAYMGRGIVKDELGDNTGAIKDYTMVIKLDPKDERAYASRGFAKYSLGDRQGALEDLSKAGELGYPQAYEAIKAIKGQ